MQNDLNNYTAENVIELPFIQLTVYSNKKRLVMNMIILSKWFAAHSHDPETLSTVALAPNSSTLSLSIQY